MAFSLTLVIDAHVLQTPLKSIGLQINYGSSAVFGVVFIAQTKLALWP